MLGLMDRRYQSQHELISEIFSANVDQIEVNEGGEDFLIFETNSGWIIRFPRNDISQKALQREIRFLARFKEHSPLPVPDYQYTADDFGAYAKIPGRPLSSALLQGFSRSTRRAIGRQLAAFLSAIHSFPVDEAVALGIQRGWNGIHHEAGRYFLDHVAGLLSPAARRNSTRCMETLLFEEFVGQVVHGDFYQPDHVFYEEKTAQLGVIDFADVTIYDPAHDFQCILEIGGERFLERVMQHYQGQGNPGLWRRSKLRLAARPLFVAGRLFAHGLQEGYSARLDHIETLFG